MRITVTNTGTLSVPLSSTQNKGFVMLLDPGVPQSVNSEDVTVANIGDNPSFAEELSASFKGLIEALGKFLTFWKSESNKVYGGVPEISVTLVNEGENGLRILLGSNVEEVTAQPGETVDLKSPAYIEIRELGV